MLVYIFNRQAKSMKKAFVSGGAGFIGVHLVKRLVEKGYSVTVFDNFSSGHKNFFQNEKIPNVTIITEDLLNLDAVKKSVRDHDIVFHLASNPDIAKSMIETDLDLKLGPIITYNVLESMRINGIKKICYASGSGVYGDHGNLLLKENFGPLTPNSLYGASKLACEGLVSAFCQSFDMQSWILRPANLVGGHMTHGVILDFILKLKKNQKELFILGDGKQSKSYLYVDDLVNGLFHVLENSSDIVNIFNIGSDSYIKVDEIAKIVIQTLGLENVELKYSGGSKGWKGDVPIVRLDIEKIKNIGWNYKLDSRQAVELSSKLTAEILMNKDY